MTNIILIFVIFVVSVIPTWFCRIFGTNEITILYKHGTTFAVVGVRQRYFSVKCIFR